MPQLSRRTLLTALAGMALLPACRTLEVRELVTLQHDASQPLRTIAMGSCLRQNRKQPVWQAIREVRPGSLYSPRRQRLRGYVYRIRDALDLCPALGERGLPGVTARGAAVVATWDDHDYGWNNSGAAYSMKKEARQIFCDFASEPANLTAPPSAGRYLLRRTSMGPLVSAHRSFCWMDVTNARISECWGSGNGSGWRVNCGSRPRCVDRQRVARRSRRHRERRGMGEYAGRARASLHPDRADEGRRGDVSVGRPALLRLCDD